MRQVRFRHFLYMSEPNPELLVKIGEGEQLFEYWQERAREVAQTPREKETVQNVQTAYAEYLHNLRKQREQVDKLGPQPKLYSETVLTIPVKQMTAYCEEKKIPRKRAII